MNLRTTCLLVCVMCLTSHVHAVDSETVLQFYDWSRKVPLAEVKKREQTLLQMLVIDPNAGVEILSKFAEPELLDIEENCRKRILNQDEVDALGAIQIFVECCSLTKKPDFIAVFTKLLSKSKSTHMRRYCCKALANYDSVDSTDGMLAAMKDKDAVVRYNAILALIKYEKIAQILRDPAHFKDADVYIKYALVAGSCKESRAEPPPSPFLSKSMAEYSERIKLLEILFEKLKMKAVEAPQF